MKRAIVVGSGPGGAAVAQKLQGAFDVTILEAGREFQRLTMRVPAMERLKRSGLLFDPRVIRLIFPHMQVRKSTAGMVLVNGVGVGGTTTICTGNALRMDADLRAVGIDLDQEFAEVFREIPISTGHQKNWHPVTRDLFAICQDLELSPVPTPKMGNYARCAHCGRCMFGCPHNIKWDAREYVPQAQARGARLISACNVRRVVIENERATGVIVRSALRSGFIPADLVILAAGGLGTPPILRRSGIACEPRLFVDPVLCVAGLLPRSEHCYEIEMPFVAQRDHYILSPYFDFLSFIFNRRWRYSAGDTVSMMIKLADDNTGSATGRRIEKALTADDKSRLDGAVVLARDILRRLGVPEKTMALGTLYAGHPGGTLPLTASQADTFHDPRLPDNVYVADATLFPKSLGNPPILTIIAMAKRVARVCAERYGSGVPIGQAVSEEVSSVGDHALEPA